MQNSKELYHQSLKYLHQSHSHVILTVLQESSYKEYSEDSQLEGDYSLNTIKIVNDSKLSILREGDHTTRLFLEKDKVHNCHYRTKMGDLMFSVLCTKLHNNLTDNGGKLDVAYSLDLNGETVSYNRFILTVKEN